MLHVKIPRPVVLGMICGPLRMILRGKCVGKGCEQMLLVRILGEAAVLKRTWRVHHVGRPGIEEDLRCCLC